jgi:hypothetical protein
LFIFFVVEEALLLRGDVDLVGEAVVVVVVVEEDAVSLGLARREVRVGGESEAGFLERDVGIRGGKNVRLW